MQVFLWVDFDEQCQISSWFLFRFFSVDTG